MLESKVEVIPQEKQFVAPILNRSILQLSRIAANSDWQRPRFSKVGNQFLAGLQGHAGTSDLLSLGYRHLTTGNTSLLHELHADSTSTRGSSRGGDVRGNKFKHKQTLSRFSTLCFLPAFHVLRSLSVRLPAACALLSAATSVIGRDHGF